MISGDKGETAQTVSQQCGIIDADKQRVLKAKAITKADILAEFKSILSERPQSSQPTLEKAIEKKN
jgi:magnesium-transporting ATPase (P-type)